MRNSTIASPGCFARIFVVFPRVKAFPDTFARIFADYPRKYRRIPHVIFETAITCGHFPHVNHKNAITCGRCVFDNTVRQVVITSASSGQEGTERRGGQEECQEGRRTRIQRRKRRELMRTQGLSEGVIRKNGGGGPSGGGSGGRRRGGRGRGRSRTRRRNWRGCRGCALGLCRGRS